MKRYGILALILLGSVVLYGLWSGQGWLRDLRAKAQLVESLRHRADSLDVLVSRSRENQARADQAANTQAQIVRASQVISAREKAKSDSLASVVRILSNTTIQVDSQPPVVIPEAVVTRLRQDSTTIDAQSRTIHDMTKLDTLRFVGQIATRDETIKVLTESRDTWHQAADAERDRATLWRRVARWSMAVTVTVLGVVIVR